MHNTGHTHQAERSYPAKVLLFGEYSVLLGSSALAIPVELFSGRWGFGPVNQDQNLAASESHQTLAAWHRWYQKQVLDIASQTLDLKKFTNELNQGLFFSSDIPGQYGMGSSGALVAGLFDRFAPEPGAASLAELRGILATMESFFHSRSSGIDPLVSYLNQPVLISNNAIEPVNYEMVRKNIQGKIFLVDSGLKGQTKSGVARFLEKKMADPVYASLMSQHYLPLIKELTDLMLDKPTGNEKVLWTRLSALQLELFTELFPPAIIELARTGLQTKTFQIKLCGSGGGGFFLMHTSAPMNAAELSAQFQRRVITL